MNNIEGWLQSVMVAVYLAGSGKSQETRQSKRNMSLRLSDRREIISKTQRMCAKWKVLGGGASHPEFMGLG